MMRGMTRKCMLAGMAALFTVGLAGCFPSRADILSDLRQSRLQSYARWRRGPAQEDMLPQVGGDLRIEDAIKLGLAYSPSIQNALQEREKAKGQLWTAYGEALPTVEVNADYTRLDQVNVVDLGVTSFAVGDEDNWSYQVTVTQPLFKGGSIPAAIRGAKLFQFLSDETIRQTVQDVIFEVAVAYYDVILAQHLYAVQESAFEFAKANVKDVTAREQAGVAIPFDRLRAEVEVSNVEADLIRQRNQLNRARTALFRAMGVSQRSEVNLATELAYVPMEPEFELAVLRAFTNRPELFQGELDVRLQHVALRILYSDYLPEVEAWAWEKWAKPDPHQSSRIDWNNQWMAGVRLTWTLFDGLQREGNIIQQRAVLRQSIIALADAEQRVLEEVRNALFDLEDARDGVKSQQRNLERANEALRLVTIGTREGVNTELEVLDARDALTETRGLYYQALYAHVASRLQLQRALGMIGPAPGVQKVPEAFPEPGLMDEFMASAPQDAPEGTEARVGAEQGG